MPRSTTTTIRCSTLGPSQAETPGTGHPLLHRTRGASWVVAVIAATALVVGCGTVDGTPDPAARTPSTAPSAAPNADDADRGETSTSPAAGDAAGASMGPKGDAAAPAAAAAPSGGDIDDVVDVEPQRVLDEVEAADEVTVSKEVTVEIIDLARTKVTARGPGEIGGPAVRVDVRLSNVTDDPVDLDGVTVTGADDSATPLSPLAVDPANPFAGELEPGAEVEGTYLFSFPDGSSAPLTVTVNPSPELPVAVFVGTP